MYNDDSSSIPGLSFDDWLPEVLGNSGELVDAKSAEAHRTCVCYELPGHQACFREGYWGPLSEAQEESVCSEGKAVKRDPDVTDTYFIHNRCMQKVKDMQNVEEKVTAWRECIKEEMDKELQLDKVQSGFPVIGEE